MTEETFARAMRLLAATWPDRSPSKETLAAYWLALAHLDDQVFMQAVSMCLRECTFYPKPAEILQRVERILANAGVLPSEPEAAWSEVMRKISGKEADLSNEAMQKTVRELGGLRRIGQANMESELPFIRRDFISRYAELRRRMIAEDTSYTAQALPSGDADDNIRYIGTGTDA
jgi:hypothetical protein